MRGEELMMKYLFRWEKERIGEEGGGEISNGYTTDKWCDDDVTEKKKKRRREEEENGESASNCHAYSPQLIFLHSFQTTTRRHTLFNLITNLF